MATRLRAMTADRISNLPGDVIERILVFLPIKDAGRTSLLSRNWRYRWRSIPQLVFDGRFTALAEVKYGNLVNEKEVVTKIYEALLAHDGLITKFEISIPILRHDPPLDLLMLHLSSKGVQELILLFEDGSYPKLHSSLFSAAFPLKRLKLQRCEVRVPSWFVGFSNLTLLELEDVALPDAFYQDFLPCCPLLEELRVLNCSSTEKHVFVSPSLKLLLFHSSLCKISFKYTPLLSLVSVLDTDEYTYARTSYVNYDPDIVSLFASLPALQHLNLGIELLLFLADGHVPYQLPTALHNLKFLQVPRILLHRLPQAQVLVCLIMSAPNLQRLTIRLDDRHEHPRSKIITSLQNLLEAEDQLGVGCLQQLEEFNIQDGRGTQIELDLVRFVFATAPILRRISIKLKDKLCSRKILKFVKNAALYKRISKEAELRYVCDDEDEDEDEYEDADGDEDEDDNW